MWSVGRGMRCERFRGGKGWGAIGFSGAVGVGRTQTDSHAGLVNRCEACGGGNGPDGECAVATKVRRERREWAGRSGKREVFLERFLRRCFRERDLACAAGVKKDGG
jgi:hypothetical protein